MPLAVPCKDTQLNLLPANLGFYFRPDNWDIVLFIAVHTSSTAISLKFIWTYIRPSNVLKLVWAKLLTFTPTDLFPPAFLSLYPLIAPSLHCASATSKQSRASGTAGAGCCDGGSSDTHTRAWVHSGEKAWLSYHSHWNGRPGLFIAEEKKLCACCVLWSK